MSIVPTLLQTRARLVQLHELLSAQRANFWTSGKFSLESLAEVQRLTGTLPNLRTESLKALATYGDVVQLPSPHESLNLSGIGWISSRVDDLSEVQRIQAVEQAIPRLATGPNATLLASATAIAKSLRDDQDEWTQKLAPLVEWAEQHRAEIDEENAA